MCGRKTLTRDMRSIIEELAIEEWQDPEGYIPSYNIAPTQLSPILIHDSHRKVKPMKWGLIPSWTKEASIGSKMINARAETLLEKPSFQNLVPKQRCIVISDGYYEWKKSGKQSIPYYIKHPENKLLPMAGLWSTWDSPEKKRIFSYTVITTTPATSIAHIHNRMPVILKNADFDIWLKSDTHSTQKAVTLLNPYFVNLDWYPVSSYVNSTHNNSPDCNRPANPESNLRLF